MDPLSDIISLLRPRSYAFRGVDAGGDWALSFEGGGGFKCFALHTGACWLEHEKLPGPVRLVAGNVALLAGADAFRLHSASDVPARDASSFFASFPAGEIRELNGGGTCSGVGGYFDFERPHAGILLGLLPPIVHIGAGANGSALRSSIERMMRELREPKPGGSAIAGHLAQALLVEALRLHMAECSSGGIGWLFALADRQMLAVLTAMHADPSRKWTLEALARVAGMSRSSFVVRFKTTVGESAMEYLTRWRMTLAADHLTNGGMPISAVAPAVGYDSESAFGAAFKRVFGVPPRRFVSSR